jgi:hypothetical protein
MNPEETKDCAPIICPILIFLSSLIIIIIIYVQFCYILHALYIPLSYSNAKIFVSRTLTEMKLHRYDYEAFQTRQSLNVIVVCDVISVIFNDVMMGVS